MHTSDHTLPLPAGFSFDWDREFATTDPAYYKWTQWIFLQLFKRGLAYQANIPVNWCPALGTVLANEEVIDGRSERGDHPVVRQPMRQVCTPRSHHAAPLRVLCLLACLPAPPESACALARCLTQAGAGKGPTRDSDACVQQGSCRTVDLLLPRADWLCLLGSGSCASQHMQTGCWRTWRGWSGMRASRTCSATGLAAPRAPPCASPSRVRA